MLLCRLGYVDGLGARGMIDEEVDLEKALFVIPEVLDKLPLQERQFRVGINIQPGF